jgi:23S rRNA pseudouridine1911/1915/1917 synthase
MPDDQRHTVFVVTENGPDRADRMLAGRLPELCSRAAAARAIREGRVLLRGEPIRPSTQLKKGDRLEIAPRAPAPHREESADAPMVEIIFEDEHIVVVNKPPALVVHPAAGHRTGTLVDALLRDRPAMAGVGESGRWGVVHRLDKDTSGVMVVAKTHLAHSALSRAFREHSIDRVYVALVRGEPGKDEGIIDAPLGRHPRDRKRISTTTTRPRTAVTRWRVQERFGGIALLRIRPRTGRTHQIRVHLAHAGLPIVGDRVYGRQRGKGGLTDPGLRAAAAVMKRQALHAGELGFVHPASGERVHFAADAPDDMKRALALCRKAREEHDRDP